MTLCVAVTTADGLVMGADSMTRIREATREKLYANANKVFELGGGLPILAMTYGVGALGRRSIESLVREWAEEREPYEKRLYTVEEVATSLCGFVFAAHKAFIDDLEAQATQRQAEALEGTQRQPSGSVDSRPFERLHWLTGLIIGGFQPGSRFPHLFSMEQPHRPGGSPGLQCLRPHEGDDGGHGPVPGINYWGDTAALDRLRFGFDGRLIQSLKQLVHDEEKLLDVLAQQEWQVIYEGMPLQDAADHVKFMLDIGSGFERFKDGMPQIGGDCDIAVVSRTRIHWEHRKPMTRALSTGSLAYSEHSAQPKIQKGSAE